MSSVTKEKNQVTQPEEGVVQLTTDVSGIAVLRLGPSSEQVITLTERRLDSLKEVILRLQKNEDLQGLVVTGPGPGMFAAGADINLIQSIQDAEEGERAASKGRSIFGLFQELKVPVVGAIEGPCLGGGLEMALCFDLRVASDLGGTSIGLPEVKLGIVPGFGGTQRMARLLGLPKALDLILQGKALTAAKAKRVGLVDRVVPSARLMQAAQQEVERLIRKQRKQPKRKLRGMDYWLSNFAPLRNFVAGKVRKKLEHGQARFYAAPKAALELCVEAFSLSQADGFAKEAKVLGQLIVSPTCKALVHLYFLTERAKRLGKSPDAQPVAQAQVIGAGAMGAGIAGLMANRGVHTRLCDLDENSLARAKQRMQGGLNKRLRRRSIKRHEAVAAQDRLAVSADWSNLARRDFFLEAVVEDLSLKQKLFKQAVDKGLPDTAILATNTSSLPVDEMAEGLPNPERVVGMHFFNPPEKMPLVEVIRGKRSSDAAIATTCKLAVRLGKFPVVVKDHPGFLVNRCLAPYLNEAARMMLEGSEPEFIDKVILDFGLPMGPARLMDEVGFDVASKVSEVMSAAFPERMQPSSLFAAMVQAGHLGKKSGGGLYDAHGKKPGPGTKVLQGLRGKYMENPLSRSEVLERLIYPMVDEAYRCLHEGLVDAEEDLDLGMVMGMGFPPFTGGITMYARQEGLKHILAKLEEMSQKLDSRFNPGPGLRQAAQGEDQGS